MEGACVNRFKLNGEMWKTNYAKLMTRCLLKTRRWKEEQLCFENKAYLLFSFYFVMEYKLKES